MTNLPEYNPIPKSPPGDTIKDVLKEKGMSEVDFVVAMWPAAGPVEALYLLNGKAAITLPIAERLAEVVGSTLQFWLTREAQYRDLQVVGQPATDADPVLVYLPQPIAGMIKQVVESGDKFFVNGARLNYDRKGFPNQFSLDVASGKRIEEKRGKKKASKKKKASAKKASKKKASKV